MSDHKQQTKKTYDTIAAGYSAARFDHFWVEEFEQYAALLPGRKVIDIGCGAGRDAAVFVACGYDYTGIDLSQGMLKAATERVPQGVFRQMDFYKLDFADGVFDGFWAAASFLHVPKKDIDVVLQEARRVIKSVGIGFIALKEKTQLDEGMIHEDRYGGISRYFAFYTPAEFQKILQRNGFEVLKTGTHREGDERQTNWLCFFVKKSA